MLQISELNGMMMGIAITAIVVFLAMMVDLASGLYKAYLRGDARRSEALKRTGYKFCLYEGTILIAAGVDVLIHISRLLQVAGWELLYEIPMITLLLGIFWCVVEFLSVREKADEKTHSDIAKAENLAAILVKAIKQLKDADSAAILEAVDNALKANGHPPDNKE